MEKSFSLFLALLFTLVATYFVFNAQYLAISVIATIVVIFGVFVIVSIIID